MLTSKRKEKISAFLDDDLLNDEIMSFSLSAESEDAKVVQRYQMLGEVLRGEMSNSSFIDVSQAVQEALADENIADKIPLNQINAAKAASKSATRTEASTTTGKSARKSGGFDLSGWFRPLAGMAVAASVAVVMVVSLTETGDHAISPVASTITTQPVAAPELRLASDAVLPADTGKQNPQVNQDLVNQHLKFATQDALQGRLPYVRAVSYEKKNGFDSAR